MLIKLIRPGETDHRRRRLAIRACSKCSSSPVNTTCLLVRRLIRRHPFQVLNPVRLFCSEHKSSPRSYQTPRGYQFIAGLIKMAPNDTYCGHCGDPADMTCTKCGEIKYCTLECLEADELVYCPLENRRPSLTTLSQTCPPDPLQSGHRLPNTTCTRHTPRHPAPRRQPEPPIHLDGRRHRGHSSIARPSRRDQSCLRHPGS